MLQENKTSYRGNETFNTRALNAWSFLVLVSRYTAHCTLSSSSWNLKVSEKDAFTTNLN